MKNDFSTLASYTRYPFAILAPQNFVEFALLEKVKEKNIRILTPYKVSGLARNEKRANTTDVKFETGEIMRAEYVIGADGARSVVSSAISIAIPLLILTRFAIFQTLALQIHPGHPNPTTHPPPFFLQTSLFPLLRPPHSQPTNWLPLSTAQPS